MHKRCFSHPFAQEVTRVLVALLDDPGTKAEYAFLPVSHHHSIDHILFTHSSADGHLCCSPLCTIVTSAAANIGTSFCLSVCFQFFAGVYQGVELLGHAATSCLTCRIPQVDPSLQDVFRGLCFPETSFPGSESISEALSGKRFYFCTTGHLTSRQRKPSSPPSCL